MKKYKIIFHIDLNAFFASCEEAKNPTLRKYPIGIGPKSDRGILTTANYVARKYGVKSAMPVKEAKRLCPKLRVVSSNFSLYQDYSDKFFDYLSGITELLEPASIDEGYLDVTEVLQGEHPIELAKTIQTTLMEKFSLPSSIGIAPNMFLAKMASELKKPMGITILRKRDVKEMLWPLPIEDMYGIGKKTVPNLKLLGIHTIGDLAKMQNIERLRKFLGSQTEGFINKAHGHDMRELDPSRAHSVQSVGNSKTYDGFLHNYEAMQKSLYDLAETVWERLKKRDLSAKTVTVQVRYSDFSTRSRSFSLDFHLQTLEEMKDIVDYLFDEMYQDIPVHLLGVSTTNLEPIQTLFRQITLFDLDTKTAAPDKISSLLKQINTHYDKQVLRKGFDE